MITTLSSFMTDESVRNSMDIMIPKSQRGPGFKISEYFGIRAEDMRNTKKLQELGVRYTKRLQDIGVSFEDFKTLFQDVIDITNDLDNSGSGQKDSTSGSDGLTEQPIVQDTVTVSGKPKGKAGK